MSYVSRASPYAHAVEPRTRVCTLCWSHALTPLSHLSLDRKAVYGTTVSTSEREGGAITADDSRAEAIISR